MNEIWEKTLRPGEKWSGVVGRGKLLQFTALGPGANVALLLYHHQDLSERYNLPDTLKAQHTAKLTRGNVLMSDNGRVLASMVEDSLGWHDTISGLTTRAMTDAKYGVTTYQDQGNDWLRSGYENMLIELVRNGLSPRDLTPVVNLFSKVQCDESGGMHYINGHCPQGATVTLRTEMDLLVLVSNTPNPLDPRPEYPATPVRMAAVAAQPVGDEDDCYNFCEENRRAFINTWNYYKLAE